MIPLISSSQLILNHNSSTYHCYTDYENRIIGRTILQKLNNDTLITFYKDFVCVKDSIILEQYSKSNLQDTIISKQSKEIKNINNTLKKIKYYKYSTIILSITTIITLLL
jgi:hypothetical protein